MNEYRRNLLNTLNGNFSVDEEHSDNSSISSNVEVSNDDNDMKMKDTINSDADDFKMKLDTRSSKAKNSIETKSMKDENILELNECK